MDSPIKLPPRHRTWSWVAPKHYPADDDLKQVPEEWVKHQPISGFKASWKLAWNFPKVIFFAVIASLVGSVLTILVERLVGHSADAVFADFSAVALWSVLGVIALMLFISWIFETAADAMIFVGTPRSVHALRLNIAHDVLTHPVMEMSPGEVLNIADEDGQGACVIKEGFGFPVYMMGSLIGAAIALFPIHAGISWATLGGAVATGLAALVVAKPMGTAIENKRVSQSSAVALITDIAQGVRVVKGLGAVERAYARAEVALEKSRVLAMREVWVSTWCAFIQQAVPAGFSVWIMLWAARLTVNGQLSPGEFMSIYLIAPSTLVVTGYSFSYLTQVWTRSVASANRINALKASFHPEETAEVKQVESPQVGLEVWHPRSPQGHADAVAAATALAEAAGRVEGSELVEVAGRRDIRKALYAPHGAHIFEGTLAENVAPTGKESMVDEALEAAACGDIIARLGGDPTAIALREAGFNLSGGQRQRVALARALAPNSELLVLEDPTTGLDAITLDQVVGRIKELRRGRSTIVISSSRAWINSADRVKEFA